MKKSFVIVCMAVFLMLTMLFTFGVMSKVFAGQVTLAWDGNDPTPDGYILFQRDNDSQTVYNYSTPVIIDGITAPNGDIPPNVTQVTVPNIGVKDKDITYYYVVRAFVEKDSGRDQSGDSNEVQVRIDDRLPEVATNFVVTYNKDTEEITAIWEQTSPEVITKWEIYTSDVSGGPYSLLDTIQNTGQTQPTATKSIAVPNGVKKTIYFVVVSFRSDTVYSTNSAEASVTIDKRNAVPPVLRVVEVVIPVTN